MNEAASALGKLARGKPKNFSAEEIAKRTARLAEAREKRKPKQALNYVMGHGFGEESTSEEIGISF